MNYAMILSGGVGSRLKGIDMPKQYYKVCGRTILSYCLEVMEQAVCMDAYVIVADSAWQDKILEEMEQLSRSGQAVLGAKFQGFAQPGQNRQMSILHGLLAIKDKAREDDIVLIQDAVRPCASDDLIQRCICAASQTEGAMPVLHMKDTVYYSVDGKKVDSLLERDKILAGQAPEAFAYGKYLHANQRLLPEEILHINGSTEPALKAGMEIALVDGEEQNFKITTAEDLAHFEKLKRDGNA